MFQRFYGFISTHPALRALCYVAFGCALPAMAADHGDAPLISNDQGADIADVYAFLNPNDNSRLTVIVTTRGFITPGESENLGFFAPDVRLQIDIENTGDARPDGHVAVRFSPPTGVGEPQRAVVSLHRGKHRVGAFVAPTTPACVTCPQPPALIVTTDPASNVSFFAGMTDDPFFFDVPAELQFRASLLEGNPRPQVFERGRDTFAGFNTMSVALDIPLAILGADNNPALGVSARTSETRKPTRGRGKTRKNIDRMGIPLINSALVPFALKEQYNRASTRHDARGAFLGPIADTLRALGTTQSNVDLLTDLAQSNGDMLRLDTNAGNFGPGGGDNPGGGFPNGRRLADDPVDVIVNIIANQLFVGPEGSTGPVDNVGRNDRRFSDEFPFLAPPHQPAF